MDALTHLPENKSKKPFEVIVVELKRRFMIAIWEREQGCSRSSSCRLSTVSQAKAHPSQT